jgi:hypothetical protein
MENQSCLKMFPPWLSFLEEEGVKAKGEASDLS